MLDKKEVEQILKIEGKTRGVVFQTDMEYVRQKKGEAGLEKLKKGARKMGYPLPYEKEIRATAWYPLSWRVISLLLIKDLFSLDDHDISEMGMLAPKYSFVVKTLLRYFISIEKTFIESAKYWQEHYSRGNLAASEIDSKNGRLVIQITDFKVHPILCLYFKGYFKTVAQLVVKSDNISVKESQCAFKGDAFCEYIIGWD